MSEPPDARDIDPGEPIHALDDFREEVSAGFLARVRGRIERRGLASQFLSLIWFVPAAIVLEALGIVFELFAGRDDYKGGSR